ncbi:hypothetical protein B0H13DRAFT_1929080 [Mycena leptocephala]|nr:hypothetical protein B0H13DRAFT_1929080 [Mycena leptocephala]
MHPAMHPGVLFVPELYLLLLAHRTRWSTPRRPIVSSSTHPHSTLRTQQLLPHILFPRALPALPRGPAPTPLLLLIHLSSIRPIPLPGPTIKGPAYTSMQLNGKERCAGYTPRSGRTTSRRRHRNDAPHAEVSAHTLRAPAPRLPSSSFICLARPHPHTQPPSSSSSPSSDPSRSPIRARHGLRLQRCGGSNAELRKSRLVSNLGYRVSYRGKTLLRGKEIVNKEEKKKNKKNGTGDKHPSRHHTRARRCITPHRKRRRCGSGTSKPAPQPPRRTSASYPPAARWVGPCPAPSDHFTRSRVRCDESHPQSGGPRTHRHGRGKYGRRRDQKVGVWRAEREGRERNGKRNDTGNIDGTQARTLHLFSTSPVFG